MRNILIGFMIIAIVLLLGCEEKLSESSASTPEEQAEGAVLEFLSLMEEKNYKEAYSYFINHPETKEIYEENQKVLDYSQERKLKSYEIISSNPLSDNKTYLVRYGVDMSMKGYNEKSVTEIEVVFQEDKYYLDANSAEGISAEKY